MRVGVGLIWYSVNKTHTEIQKQCVEALLGSKTSHNTHVYVLVNRHIEGDFEWLARQNVDVMAPEEELSVAQGWNRMIKTSLQYHADYVLIMNSDIIVFPDTIDKLIEFAEENPDMVAWGPSLNKPDKSFRHWPPFACFMVNQRTKDLVGLFDNGFQGAYTEDTSFKYKVFKLGFKMLRSMDIIVVHKGSYVLKNLDDKELADKIHANMKLNKQYFIKKHGIHPHEWRVKYNRIGMSAGGYDYPFDDLTKDWRNY
ncbi:glycosyltransferase [Candidatus Babeliales bacterium]|nr:glycosyltransferase [Candidatus Babeliales bacterium]